MPREIGFYWIYCRGEPEVAEWNGVFWFTSSEGLASPWPDDEVRVVSERLLPPSREVSGAW